jgi:hypothetical protein
LFSLQDIHANSPTTFAIKFIDQLCGMEYIQKTFFDPGRRDVKIMGVSVAQESIIIKIKGSLCSLIQKSY